MAATNFQKALNFTLAYEGGFVDDPRDPGGATMRGVTLKTFRQYHLGATVTQLRNASMSDFTAIYRAGFWDKIGASILPPGVDLIAFDIAVNMGPPRAEEWLVQTANMRPVDRIKALDKKRLGFWKSLTRSWKVFGRGWCNRENACMKAALALAA